MKFMRSSHAAFIISLSLLLPLSGPAAGEESKDSSKLAGPVSQGQVGESMTPLQPVVLMADPGFSDLRVPPPPEFTLQQKGLMAVQATVSINYLLAGPGRYGDNCIAWPANVQAAFTYAANIWASQLQSSVPITIDACWANNLPTGVLGHAGATSIQRDFTGAPVASTWYPVPLANALHGSDLDPAQSDIYAAFDSNRSNWYFGTDGLTPPTQYDFASVILHEMTHGLGFSGSMDVTSGQGSWGGGSIYPYSYDRSTENASAQSLINTSLFPNPSVALATQLQSNALYFDATNANAANGGSRVPLYAPTTWSSGSSYSHLAESYNGTVNALMTYSLANGESIHNPGPVAQGILKDVGWTMGTTYTLTLATAGTGSGTVGGGGSYAAGATVTLTATPGAGSTFTGWSPSPCAASFSMPAGNLTCTATFALSSGATNLIVNGGFESGSASWAQTATGGASVVTSGAANAHTGSWYAWLGGYVSGTDTLYQDVTIPAGASQATLQFWYRITTAETTTSTAYDTMVASVNNASTGAPLATIANFSNLSATTGWVLSPAYDLIAYRGQTVRIKFTAVNDGTNITSFLVDDVSLMVTVPPSADLSVTQTPLPNPASAGKDLVYSLSVANAGSASATSVALTDTLPAGATYIWGSSGCANASGTVTCSLGTLASGASTTVKVVVRPAAAGSVTNTASVSSAVTDPNSANNSSSSTITVNSTPAGTQALRYRLYSPVTLEHHFTTDLNEYTVLGGYVGTWVQEGTVGKVLNNPGSFGGVTATPYYRLYNTSTQWHHWTTDSNEYYTLIQFPWWNAEGVDGYILPTTTTGATQLYRLLYPFIPGLHHWTIDPTEYSILVSTYGWIGEGGAGFVIQ